MPEPLKFSTPNPSSLPMISVILYLQTQKKIYIKTEQQKMTTVNDRKNPDDLFEIRSSEKRFKTSSQFNYLLLLCCKNTYSRQKGINNKKKQNQSVV